MEGSLIVVFRRGWKMNQKMGRRMEMIVESIKFKYKRFLWPFAIHVDYKTGKMRNEIPRLEVCVWHLNPKPLVSRNYGRIFYPYWMDERDFPGPCTNFFYTIFLEDLFIYHCIEKTAGIFRIFYSSDWPEENFTAGSYWPGIVIAFFGHGVVAFYSGQM